MVIGSTRPTGLHVLRLALERGWDVSTVVRSPEKLGDLADKVEVLSGDFFDPAVLHIAAKGADAAVSVVGAPAGFLSKGATDIYSRSAAALCTALPEADVRRLIFCTSAGVEHHDPSEKFVYRWFTKPFFLQRGYNDMMVAESTIKGSNLDWVLVRPGHLVDREPAGPLRVRPELRPPGGVEVSRSALALFLLDQVSDYAWVRGIPTITE